MTVSPAENKPRPGREREVTVDARGLRCPQPLLAMRRALREHPVGTLVRVLATDEGSWRDFHSFAQLSGVPLVKAERRSDGYCYWLRVGK
ncbi:sulfurtransferase TusA family protein [Microbulbifer thermotolerans]|uniref:SirA-like domain-containing protein n=1 Tax=Microbulbifer thermotolerans TaxID=252514 RepID=A0A143HJS6_MICTH|nr:sulfurtransferase TusA family protein [Microbulbifer thermotolerans]AMX01761.1 SirA-like domain-containing protein [Microbulbifer thermotolerans]MCX2779536.1 sulfurtransferase TusA family protein [Microbulbifer thermotolerans]MCX2783372.1 sulfurtransferase TusA family protein [Microbulbifer thermotolerans]MCX2793408.1 sulfurtransferase TusA family protein [Microbulbifer thermotolerans]MCX2801349.1 sulfurtransferase TusA family protein [Microbulbifer thermotolerans]